MYWYFTWFKEFCRYSGQEQSDDGREFNVWLLYTVPHNLHKIKHLFNLWEPCPLELGQKVCQHMICSPPHHTIMATQTSQGEGQTLVLYKLTTIQHWVWNPTKKLVFNISYTSNNPTCSVKSNNKEKLTFHIQKIQHEIYKI